MSFAAITKEIEAEYAIPIFEEDLAVSSMLNHAQRGAFNKIMQKSQCQCSNCILH